MEKWEKQDIELEKMKAKLKGTVDINYARYNNEYMDIAFDREVDRRKSVERNAKKKERDAAEVAAKEISSIMRRKG